MNDTCSKPLFWWMISLREVIQKNRIRKKKGGEEPNGKKSPKSPYATVRLSQGSKEAGLPIHVLPTPVVTQAFRPFSSYLNGGKVIKAMR